MKRINILDCPVDNLTMEETIEMVKSFVQSGSLHQIVPINAAKLWRMEQDDKLAHIVKSADLIVPEKAIVMGSRVLGVPLKAHIGGVMLLKALMPIAAEQRYRLYFLGARQEVIESMVTNLKQVYPNIQIAGWHNGYLFPDDYVHVVNEIRSKKPDMLFVAMGTPKQEYWIDDWRDDLCVPVCMGVGGSFDVLAGVKKDAPDWVRTLSIEWLYRLLQDPRNLWKRYLTTIPWFLYKVMVAGFKKFLDYRLKPACKRFIDIAFSSFALILLIPLMLLIAITIRLTSKGSALYRWPVVGKSGQPFRAYKFRTMVIGADEIKNTLLENNEASGPIFKMKDDPRITLIGRILRRYSLDELPQLLSILKGDMSLVGPRPVLTYEWEQFNDWQRKKLETKPGAVCIWHLKGQPRDLDDWVNLDLEYIKDWSIWLDTKIFFGAIWYMLSGKNY